MTVETMELGILSATFGPDMGGVLVDLAGRVGDEDMTLQDWLEIGCAWRTLCRVGRESCRAFQDAVAQQVRGRMSDARVVDLCQRAQTVWIDHHSERAY